MKSNGPVHQCTDRKDRPHIHIWCSFNLFMYSIFDAPRTSNSRGHTMHNSSVNYPVSTKWVCYVYNWKKWTWVAVNRYMFCENQHFLKIQKENNCILRHINPPKFFLLMLLPTPSIEIENASHRKLEKDRVTHILFP